MRILFLLMMVSGALAACGVKPGGVDAPGGAENDRFPRAYPTDGAE